MVHSRRTPSFGALQAIGWSGLYALAAISSLPDLHTRGAWREITVFVGTLFAISLVLHRVYRAWWNAERTWREAGIMSAIASAVGAVVAASGPFRWSAGDASTDWAGWPFDATECFIVLSLWSALYFGIKVYLDAESTRERAILSASEARRARLSALRAQLNPHFLFNALNGVSTLILEHENARANAMLTQVSMLLRASLDDDAADEIPLQQELDRVELYLSIERTRFEGLLQFESHVADDALAALVPTMILQPLVENAVRHGVAHSTVPVVVRLTAAVERRALRVTLENSIAPSVVTASGGGLGLANTRERLATLYGADGRLTTTAIDGVFRVGVMLPLRMAAAGTIACAS